MEMNFIKVHTAKDLTISVILIAVGIALFFVNKGLGVTIAVLGIFMLIFYKSGYKREGSSTVLTKKAFDVSISCRQPLMDFLNGIKADPVIAAPLTGGVIRIEAYFNKMAEVAYVQLFDFYDYTYQKATDIVELRGQNAANLIANL
jgi:hypothetical protein